MIPATRANALFTGSNGFLGRHVRLGGYSYFSVRSNEYDLRDQADVNYLLNFKDDFDTVLHLAAHVGGIQYNLANPATLFNDNVLMNTHLINEAAQAGIKRFIFISSVCAYPQYSGLPTKEIHFWDDKPEASNLTYGLSKRMALAQLEACKEQYGMEFDYLILSNLYGPGDSFSPDKSHVVAALIHKFATKDSIEVWGNGQQSRDLLYVEDAADAIITCLNSPPTNKMVNISTNIATSVKQIVELLIEQLGYTGKIRYNEKRPVGQLQRRYDNSVAKRLLNWQPVTTFPDGLKKTVEWYLAINNNDE